MNRMKYFLYAVLLIMAVSCVKDPWADVAKGDWNHERSILDIKFKGQAGTAVITNTDAAAGTIDFNLVTDRIEDFSKVEVELLTLSYNAVADIAAGETIDCTKDAPTITVSSPNGDVRVYTLNMKEFSESLVGKYRITGSKVWGGTGPEYGGGAIMGPEQKSWCWDENGYGPTAEYDDYFEITLDDITAAGHSTGTCVHYGGADGRHWNCIFEADMNKEGTAPIDLHKFYRQIPVGTSRWLRNYSDNTITFTDASGRETVCTLLDAGDHAVYMNADAPNYNKTLTVENQALKFSLSGTDDWSNIYSDYDKFVKKPRAYFVLVERVDEIPAEAMTDGTEGEINLDPPPAVLAESIELAEVLEKGLILTEGAVYQLGGLATVLPENTTDPTIVYSSSNEDVVTVDAAGLVTVKAIGSAVITLSCGEVQAYVAVIVQPKEANASIAGTYKFQLAAETDSSNDKGNPNLLCYGRYDSPFICSPVKKSWVWNSSIWTIKDDVLVLTPTGVDENGNECGEADYQPGENGKYWDAVLLAEKNKFDSTQPLDLSGTFIRIPHGKSEYVFDAAAGTVSFTSEGVTYVAKFLEQGTYSYGTKTLVVTSTFAFDFDLGYKGTPEGYDSSWNYTDFDLFVNARNVIMCFDKQ